MCHKGQLKLKGNLQLAMYIENIKEDLFFQTLALVEAVKDEVARFQGC